MKQKNIESLGAIKIRSHDPDEIPVIHIIKDTPEFEMNAINPDTEGSDEEEHEGWNSNEDEEAYQNDAFENEEEEKNDGKDDKPEASDYEEDFESEEETDCTNEKSNITRTNSRRETTVKKLEKVKKERQILESLLQERSSMCVKQIGNDAYHEIIGFLRAKIGVKKCYNFKCLP